jgi:hypothetical protein
MNKAGIIESPEEVKKKNVSNSRATHGGETLAITGRQADRPTLADAKYVSEEGRAS